MKIESWLRIESKFNKGIYYLPPLLPSPNQKKKKSHEYFSSRYCLK